MLVDIAESPEMKRLPGSKSLSRIAPMAAWVRRLAWRKTGDLTLLGSQSQPVLLPHWRLLEKKAMMKS